MTEMPPYSRTRTLAAVASRCAALESLPTLAPGKAAEGPAVLEHGFGWPATLNGKGFACNAPLRATFSVLSRELSCPPGRSTCHDLEEAASSQHRRSTSS